MAFISTFVISMLFSQLVFVCHCNPTCKLEYPIGEIPVYKEDRYYVHFAQNLEFLEAEFFLWSSYGYGLDVMEPWLTKGGAPPIGAQKANLDPFTLNIIKEFGNEEIGHLRYSFNFKSNLFSIEKGEFCVPIEVKVTRIIHKSKLICFKKQEISMNFYEMISLD